MPEVPNRRPAFVITEAASQGKYEEAPRIQKRAGYILVERRLPDAVEERILGGQDSD